MADEEEEYEGEEEDDEEYEGESTALGLERWVMFAFVLVAVASFFVFERLTTVIWDAFGEPDTTIIYAASLAVGVLSAFFLYRHQKVNDFAHDVAEELSKVVWPTRKETYSQTVVVIVTSIIAAIILGVIDFVWSKLTDLIYTV